MTSTDTGYLLKLTNTVYIQSSVGFDVINHGESIPIISKTLALKVG